MITNNFLCRIKTEEVKDFLMNETYNYDINRMLQRLDFYKVNYIKENMAVEKAIKFVVDNAKIK